MTEDDGGKRVKKLGGWAQFGECMEMKARGWMEYWSK